VSEICTWAEFSFKLNLPDKDGITQREHLEQVERQIGRRPEALEAPTDFPMLLSHVWSAFCSLSNSRASGFSGPSPITYTEIQSWKEATQTPLYPWEVEAIKRIDVVYIGVTNSV
tara:strand:+ start:248 stop:592 length:345 start_codon:yes stop_codon:yes gene_type:complete